MWEKIVPFWRDLSLHIYGTTQERLGFNASNIILGEIPLTPPKKRVEISTYYLANNTFFLICFKV